MTITNTFTNGTLTDADKVNTNFKDSKWSPQIYSHAGLGISGSAGDTLAHSSTTWTRLQGAGTQRTTDAGVTWTATVTGDVVNMVYGKVSTADKTKAISFKNADLNVAISGDSGANWAQATTDPADQIYSLSFPTATVAVVGTNKSAGARGIYFSSDAGDTWTICTTGPAVAVPTISMFSATTGFAVDNAGNIWKTTDGGDNWTDTTHGTVGPITGANIVFDILAISATEFVGNSSFANQAVIYYNGTTASTIWDQLQSGTSTTSVPFNPIKLSNGEFIFGWRYVTTGEQSSALLLKFSAKDSTDCQIMDLSHIQPMQILKLTTSPWCSILQEYDTNKIMFTTVSNYMLIDESN